MYQSRFCSPTRRTEWASTSECRMSLYAVARDCFVALSASAGRILPRTRKPKPPNAPAAHYEGLTRARPPRRRARIACAATAGGCR